MNATQATRCPTDVVLRDFGLGKLDASSTETVARHIETCPDCQRRVATISGDSFVGRLRQAGGGAKPDVRRERTYVPGESLANAANSTDGSLVKEDGLPRRSRADDGRGRPSHERDGLGSPSSVTAPTELANHPDYELIKELGQGGMGTVYLAKNRMMDRLEVLKVISKELLARPGALERFQQEIRSAAKLQHPNIVAAYSVLRPGDLLVFAMEYVKGQDLSQVVKARGYLPVANAAFYIHQVANGLQHAHEKGMVHRDIKPNNLMLAVEGKKHIVKILDFGLAKATSEKGAESGLTKSGQMLGTPDYVAPEQTLDAHQADIRADIYSLGCTLYFLLSGGPPFQENSLFEILRAHHERDPKPLNLVRAEVPAELAAVVAKMMAKKPDNRFQTPGEVAKALVPFFKPGQSSAAPPLGETHVSAAIADQLPPAAADISIASAAFANDFSVSIATHRHAPKQRGMFSSLPPWQRWTAAGLAALVLCLGAIVIIRNRKGEEVARITVPEKGTVEVKPDDKPNDPTPAADGEIKNSPPRDPVQPASPSPVQPSTPAPTSIPRTVDPAFEQWVKDVRSLPAEKQVEAVAKKLQELNPGFDGQVTHKIEDGVVTEFGIVPEKMDKVAQIAPVSALEGLKNLTCRGVIKPEREVSDNTRAPLTDLSPLAGMSLGELNICGTRVSDLSPLAGMPLTAFHCMDTPVADLSSLRGMSLTKFTCSGTAVSDLSPLREMPLTTVVCGATAVSDLSPLKGMRLTHLIAAKTKVSDLSPAAGMPLEMLSLSNTPVADLSPLAGIPLKHLWLTSTNVTDLSPLASTSLAYLWCDVNPERDAPILRSVKTLVSINGKPVADFWKDVANVPAPTAVPAPSPSELSVKILPVAEKTVYPGEPDVVPIRIARNGYNGAVSVSLQGLPNNFNPGTATIPAGQTRALVDLEIPQDASIASAEVRVIASFENRSVDNTFTLTVRKRPPVRPFEVVLSGLGGQTSMKPISFGPDWLGFNKPQSPDAWKSPGVFARLETKAALGYPTIPIARYVLEMELELLRPKANGKAAGGMIELGDPWRAGHLSINWDDKRSKFEIKLNVWHYGGWGWNGTCHVEVGERLPLKWICFDGRQVLCLRNKPILGVEDSWPADLTLRIWSATPGLAVIHRCSCREVRQEDADLVDSATWHGKLGPEGAEQVAGLMPEAGLRLDPAVAKARIEGLRKGLPNRPASGKPFAAGRVRSPMAWIAPGEYWRGSTERLSSPRHRVKITQGFWMGRLEVTQEEFKDVMHANPSRIKGSPYLPVDWVTWQDAMAFCEKLNQMEGKARRLPQGYLYRLPTDAEWEYACRAGTEGDFSVPSIEVLSREHSGRCPHEVGENSANAWGLFDMHGNAMEWCLDGWHDYPKDTSTMLVDPYRAGDVNKGTFIVRGGAWWAGNGACRSYWRNQNHSSPVGNYCGFRIVLGPTLKPTN